MIFFLYLSKLNLKDMSILKEVIEVTYSDIVIQSLLCVTVGLILAMVIEEFKK